MLENVPAACVFRPLHFLYVSLYPSHHTFSYNIANSFILLTVWKSYWSNKGVCKCQDPELNVTKKAKL